MDSQLKIKDWFNGKKVLIAGGQGFIGSSLCRRLRNFNCDIYVIDNNLTSEQSYKFTNISYINDCISNVTDYFGNEKFDLFYHFGEYSRVEQSMQQPYLALRNITQTFPKVIEFADTNCERFIYSGSSTKFYAAGAGAYLSPYTLAKKQNIELLKLIGELKKINYTSIYFSNVYGLHDYTQTEYKTLISKLITYRNNGKTTFPVTGPGSQTRQFTHIDDTISGILYASVFGAKEDYVISADEEYSVIEIVKRFGLKPEIVSTTSANRLKSGCDNSNLKALGWSPKKNLMEFIQTCLKD